jgi:3-deoxy-manno-octulosonate cytidylyltransferase (CMP-KDO synthetase)
VLDERSDCVMSTAAHAIDNGRLAQPERGEGGAGRGRTRAVLQPCLDSALARRPSPDALPAQPPALRHIGLYAYRAAFLRRFPTLSPAPAGTQRGAGTTAGAVARRTHRRARHRQAPGIGVDTPEDLQRVRRLFA